MNDESQLYCTTFPTPLGEFSIAVDETGAVVATAFGDEQALRTRLEAPKSRSGAASSRRIAPSICLLRDPGRTAAARAQVEAYFQAAGHAFTLPLAPRGTPFQKRIWDALGRIPFGETRSYGEVARQLVSSARAVGRANATNPICLIVPCHRVIGADGSLTGFAFGTALKERLLEHEGALPAHWKPFGETRLK
jgi:methylated-DNA-[protein]-cysteine S-methyltransferase